jgi:hypothetical protein
MVSAANGSGSSALVASQFDSTLETQLDTTVTAQAQRINAQLGESEAAVLQLQALAQQVFSLPEVFAGKLPESLPFLHPATPVPQEQPATEGGEAQDKQPAPPPVEEHPLDNPVYYSLSGGGALRKQIDDGHSAVFMKARPLGAAFTRHDAQRLFASAALDPLLAKAAGVAGTGAQAYLLTNDSLLRTYPYIDLNSLEDDKDLTGLPIYAWSKPKANSRGIVWAGPYLSRFSSAWVVSCMAEVNVGGQMLGVAGIELPISAFKEHLLGFSLGRDSAAWLTDSSGLVIACQDQAPALLGLAALADAGQPNEQTPGEKLKTEATLSKELNPDLYGNIEQAAAVAAGTGSHKDGTFLRSAKIESTGWVLYGHLTSSLIRDAYLQEASGDSRMRRMLVWVAAVLFIALLIAFSISWLEARRLAQPLAILTQQVRQAAISRSSTSMLISDDSEVGALAHAVQELVDQLPGPAAGSGQPTAESGFKTGLFTSVPDTTEEQPE